MAKKKALIIVDLQNDFCKGGNLEVPNGHEIVPLANQLQAYFDIVIATKDWHPQEHMSFASNHADGQVGDIMEINSMSQILWPDHCIQGTKGAELHPELNTQYIDKIFYKGIDKKIDSYSAFFDNAHQRSTGLGEYLHQHQIKDIFIIGLATDYCVKYSSLDALHVGLNVCVIEDACRGVNLNPDDVKKALKEMHGAGVKLIHSREILKANQVFPGAHKCNRLLAR